MQARDVMTAPAITAAPDTGVAEIAKTLTGNRISAVPVVDGDGRLVGIVSEGDLIRRVETGTGKERGAWWLSLFALPEQMASEYAKSHGRRAADVMTRDVVSVAEDTPLSEIAGILERRHIKRVPVVRDGKPVGIVSRANLVQGLATATAPAAPAAADDRTVRKAVLDRLHAEPWVQRAFANVTVENGTVHLWGLADSPEQIRAIEVLARETPGVGAVESHLSVIEPRMFYGE